MCKSNQIKSNRFDSISIRFSSAGGPDRASNSNSNTHPNAPELKERGEGGRERKGEKVGYFGVLIDTLSIPENDDYVLFSHL